MNESNRIWLKYEDQGLLDRLESLDDVNRLALTFCGDVARTYRLPSRCGATRVETPPDTALPTHPSSGF